MSCTEASAKSRHGCLKVHDKEHDIEKRVVLPWLDFAAMKAYEYYPSSARQPIAFFGLSIKEET